MADTYSTIQQASFTAPQGWQAIETIDMHTGGEPLRVVLGGFPELPGNTVLERRQYARQHHDALRTALMWEPRGHADMYGCLLVPPNDAGAHFGVIFIHNEGYSTMCGHAIIALAKLAVQMGWVPLQSPETPVTIDAPCGRIYAYARVADGQVVSTRFEGVPSFVAATHQQVEVPGLGSVAYHLAYGGAWYAYVNTELPLVPENHGELIARGRAIKQAVAQADARIVHPFEEDLSFLYGTIFIGGPTAAEGSHSRNVCIFADGEVDRSPTGSGVMGRLALHHALGEIGEGQPIVVESITGAAFTGTVLRTEAYGPYKNAVIPQVEGTAYITGQHTFYIDPADPMAEGFLLR